MENDNNTQKAEDQVPAVQEKFNIAQLRTDKKKDVDGVWVDYYGGLRFRIAHAGNVKADAYRNKLLQQKKHAVQQADMGVILDVNTQVMARCILLDWENMQDYDEQGNEVDVPYSEEKAYDLLKNVDKFRRVIDSYSEDMALFQNEQQVKAAKN